MASAGHVDSFKNPYHYCFSICAGGNYTPSSSSNGNKGENSSNKTYYSYEPRPFLSKPMFNCDLCDRSFKTQVQFDRHVSEHVTCGEDGCEFTAHPKVVAVHFRSQHETGVFHLIQKLKAPDEVKKWIEERRRKYPTQKNITEQKLIEEDKIRRGEIIKPDNERFNKNFGKRQRSVTPGERQKRKPRRNNTKKERKPPPLKVNQISAIVDKEVREESNGGVLAFQGFGSGEDKVANEVKAAEKIVEPAPKETPKKDPPLLVNKSLAFLMTSYESGDDDDDQPPVSAAEKLQSDNSDSDSAPEEVKTVKTLESPVTPSENTSSRRKRTSLKRNNYKNPKRRKTGHTEVRHQKQKQTLLQKLLHDQVVRDRQLILSSIRCLVRCNFFDTGNKIERTTKKSALLQGLLKDEIIRERNMILQCIRQIVNNNFFESEQD